MPSSEYVNPTSCEVELSNGLFADQKPQFDQRCFRYIDVEQLIDLKVLLHTKFKYRLSRPRLVLGQLTRWATIGRDMRSC